MSGSPSLPLRWRPLAPLLLSAGAALLLAAVVTRNPTPLFLALPLLLAPVAAGIVGPRSLPTRGTKRCGFRPDKILITSLFTYWSKYVHEAAAFYHAAYPSAKIEIGGIYASLMPEQCKRRSLFATVATGLYRGGVAEKVPIDYTLLPEPLDYQIVHLSRGCPRHCAFCGTWRIEPDFTVCKSVLPFVQRRKLVFYDNNLLANPSIDCILEELRDYRMKGVPLSCESQSGFDLGYLTLERARLLKDAHFIMPRIAWDGSYATWPKVRKAVRMLKKVGYRTERYFHFHDRQSPSVVQGDA